MLRRQSCAQAIIEGYKSYKDQTISEPFDQHINVVGELLTVHITAVAVLQHDWRLMSRHKGWS